MTNFIEMLATGQEEAVQKLASGEAFSIREFEGKFYYSVRTKLKPLKPVKPGKQKSKDKKGEK